MTLLFAVMATLSVNAYDFEVDGLYFDIVSKTEFTCELTYKDSNYNSYSGDVVLPDQVVYNGNTYRVVSINYHTFMKSAKLKSVVLPESIGEIGGSAFQDCVLLKSIIIPSSVKTLGSYCFSGCVSLENINLGRCQTISSYCFKGCVSLEKIIIPSSVTKLPFDSFEDCTSFTTLVFEDSKESINVSSNSKFKECPLDSIYIGRNLSSSITSESKTLRSVYISENVTNIPSKLFYNCSALKNVYGMENVEEIGESCFQGCTNLIHFVIGNKVTKFGQYLFSGCTSLETLVVGDGIKGINSSLIYGCNLKALYLGKNITIIDRNAFGSTAKIQRIYLFSDVLTSVYHYIGTGTYQDHAIPLTVEAIYVANPQRYETLLSDYYNLRPLMTFNDASVEYTGKTPDLSYRNNVEGMEVSFNNETTPKDVGNYNTNLDVTFANDDWSTIIEIPCSYSVTKAPLSIIADDVQRGYGEDNPELSCIYMGFKNGETEEVLDVLPTLYTTATKESNVGTYPIYASNAEAKNYDIRYERGSLVVNKASQNISWEQEFSNAKVGDIIELTATSSVGLPVKYRSSDSSVAYVLTQNGKQYVYILKSGLVILTAYQSGDANHEEAEEENKILNIQATGINGVYTDLNTSCTYYTIDGRQITEPSKSGVTIVKMNDGTIRKITSK